MTDEEMPTPKTPLETAKELSFAKLRISELEKENEALRHDIARYVKTNTDLLNR